MELADDTLLGAKAIAEFTGFNLRRTNYLLEHGLLPAFKIGDRWCMRKSKYLAMIEASEAEVRDACAAG